MAAIFERTLDNGLRIAVRPDPSVPIVGIVVYYDVGSRNEEPGKSGFAHLFEHLMFEGSEHAPKGDHFRLIHAWGGQVNGTTSQDRTTYFESLPSHRLALGLWLEADRMRALALTPENFENQRQTVMEERRQRIDDAPYGRASLRAHELSFRCWAMAHPVIGTWEDLQSARFEDAAAFHRTWYCPDNAVLAVAGDADPDFVFARVDDWFGDIARGTPPRPLPDLAEPPREAPIRAAEGDRLARLPAVLVNHPAPPFDHPDFFVWEVIESVLFRGPSSRLYRRLVIDEQRAVQVEGGYEAHRGPSLFGAFLVAPSGGDLDGLVAAYQGELDRIAAHRLAPDELRKTMNQLRSARAFSAESALSQAIGLGRAVMFHGDAEWEERYLDRVAEVTADDVLRVASGAFPPERRLVLEVCPS